MPTFEKVQSSKFKIQNSPTSNGFTLIELLVAISILAVVGTLLFVDFGPFREERSLQIVGSQIQNFIRTTQVNATSGVLCNDLPGASWSVKFDKTNQQLIRTCTVNDEESDAIETLNLEQGVVIENLVVSNQQIGTDTKDEDLKNCTENLIISFSHVLGKVSFYSGSDTVEDSCGAANTQYAGAVLTKNGDKKFVIMNKGGVVYVE